jgi:hypothetical protein
MSISTRVKAQIKYVHKKDFKNHIFTHKCEIVEFKPFQSLSNHHHAKYWVYRMLYKILKILNVLKVGQKYVWNWLMEWRTMF